MQVWMATRLIGGQFQGWEEVGFLPRKICLSCHESFAAKDFERPACRKCGITHDSPKSFINQYIRQNYFDLGKGIFYAAWWINQARDKPSSWGCKLALGLPPI
jgi:ribosomal protein S27AE